jgi:hypothetical protein
MRYAPLGSQPTCCRQVRLNVADRIAKRGPARSRPLRANFPRRPVPADYVRLDALIASQFCGESATEIRPIRSDSDHQSVATASCRTAPGPKCSERGPICDMVVGAKGFCSANSTAGRNSLLSWCSPEPCGRQCGDAISSRSFAGMATRTDSRNQMTDPRLPCLSRIEAAFDLGEGLRATERRGIGCPDLTATILHI